MKSKSRFVLLALLTTITACGGSSSPTVAPTPTPPSKAIIKVLVDPNPVLAVSSGDPDYPWAFRVNLQLSDSGGVGFIVTSMQTTVTSAISGLVLTTTSENPFVGVKIPANGQETRQFGVLAYRMENRTKEGTINFKMNFTDDRGNASVSDTSVNLRHLSDPVRLPH